MPFWIPGHSVCRHCGEVLQHDDDVFLLPAACLPDWEPMANFREAPFHRSCWLVWPHRERFIERVNVTNSRYRFDHEGNWAFVGDRRCG
jgi:hypothetical protein